GPMDAEVEFPKRAYVMYTRKAIYLGLLACLLVPVFLVAGFGLMMGAKGIVVISLLSASMGTIAGWFLMTLWERKMQRSVAQIVQARLEKTLSAPQTEKFDAEIQRLMDELEKAKMDMDKKLEEMRIAYLEYEDL